MITGLVQDITTKLGQNRYVEQPFDKLPPYVLGNMTIRDNPYQTFYAKNIPERRVPLKLSMVTLEGFLDPGHERFVSIWPIGREDREGVALPGHAVTVEVAKFYKGRRSSTQFFYVNEEGSLILGNKQNFEEALFD